MRSLLQNTRNVDHVRFNLTLVRHGETHANAEGIIQGLIDTKLSDIGYLQSQALGRYLQHHAFSHIYSSDLRRASETVGHIHQLNQVSTCEIKYDELLRERRYGIAQGRTRQWLRELAKEHGVPYANYTPPGAETTTQVRERAIKFFQKLCQDLREKFSLKSTRPRSATTALAKDDAGQVLSRSTSAESVSCAQEIRRDAHRPRSLSAGDSPLNSTMPIAISQSYHSSIDSALELSSVSSGQQSISSSSSLISRNSSFEKQRTLTKSFFPSPYKNQFSNLDVLLVSHGGVIRELIKYFACDLQTDIGEHFDTIQNLAPNTSITRFQVTCSINDTDAHSNTTLELVDYHNKAHLIRASNEECNLDVVNKCSL